MTWPEDLTLVSLTSGELLTQWWVEWFANGSRERGSVPYQVITKDETDCISHSTNTLGEGMNPIILPPAMGK